MQTEDLCFFKELHLCTNSFFSVHTRESSHCLQPCLLLQVLHHELTWQKNSYLMSNHDPTLIFPSNDDV